MNTKRIYLCEIAEVVRVNQGLAGYRVLDYKKQNFLRLAIREEDKVTGERFYRLIINDEKLSTDYKNIKVAGETFVIKASNLLAISETPIRFARWLSRSKLLKVERYLNESLADESVPPALRDEQVEASAEKFNFKRER